MAASRHHVAMARPRHDEVTAEQARDLRSRMTVSEARLWALIRRRALGARFRRQVPVGMWIADFACLDLRLVIEVDDRSHEWKEEDSRTAYLREQGFWMLRFTNRQVATDLEAVVGTIRNALAMLEDQGVSPPVRRGCFENAPGSRVIG